MGKTSAKGDKKGAKKKGKAPKITVPDLDSGSYPTATVTGGDAIACFKKGTKDKKGEIIFAETSAVCFDGDRIIIASDKEFPGHSSFVTWKYPLPEGEAKQLKAAKFYDQPIFKTTRKVEELTATIDGTWIFATSAFDRNCGSIVKKDDKKGDKKDSKKGSKKKDDTDWGADNYCNLIAWPAGEPDKVQVVEGTKNKGGVTSSVSLVKKMEAAIDDQTYHKFEGLVCMPDNWLVWGLREVGDSFKDFKYVVQLVGTTYTLPKKKDGAVKLGKKFEKVYEFDPQEVVEGMPNVAVSSMDYNKSRKLMVIVTTYEKDGVFGAYFWLLPYASYKSGEPPTIIVDANKTSIPFSVSNKAEGAAWVGDNNLLLICDDDREAETGDAKGFKKHAPHTGYYIEVELEIEDLPGASEGSSAGSSADADSSADESDEEEDESGSADASEDES